MVVSALHLPGGEIGESRGQQRLVRAATRAFWSAPASQRRSQTLAGFMQDFMGFFNLNLDVSLL